MRGASKPLGHAGIVDRMNDHINAFRILASISGSDIREMIRQLEVERKALQALLRSVAARARAAARRQGRERETEVLHG